VLFHEQYEKHQLDIKILCIMYKFCTDDGCNVSALFE